MDLQAFLITFREALEAILIVGVILTYLTRIEAVRWHKWVWVGVFLALLASYGLALVFQILLTGFAAMGSQNYLKIGIMLVSSGLLTHMILFMGKQNSEMQGKVQSKIANILTIGGAVNMVVHSFLVVVREGVETVFFFAAITGGDIQKALQSWGALGGLILAGVVGILFFKGTKKIRLSTFFRITAIFLMMISAGLFVQAIGIMQDLGIMGSMYRTVGHEIGEIYNITGIMAEHPIDSQQYLRDTGQAPLINGQVGIFFKAFLGYTQNPSLEEFIGYWGYYALVVVLLAVQRKRHEKEMGAKLANSSEAA